MSTNIDLRSDRSVGEPPAWAGPLDADRDQPVRVLVFSKVLFPLRILRLTVILGGRALASAGPSLNVSFPALASFLWYTRRALDLALTASLICFGCSLLILGSMAPTQPPPTSSKAAHPERSTGRCRSKTTGRATILCFLFQLLGLSSAETLDPPELPASPSSVSVWAVLLIVGLLLFGEPCFYSLTCLPRLSLPISLTLSLRSSTIVPCYVCVCRCRALGNTLGKGCARLTDNSGQCSNK